MKTTSERRPAEDEPVSKPRVRGRDRIRWLALLAGPLVIVVAVVLLLRSFVFQGRLSTQHPDLLAYWLPTYCYLGKSLRAMHVPLWNPYAMGGVPFAADPQSGWMYVPAMLLSTALPCGLAVQLMVALQPVLAGLGVYWFTRNEGLGRPAATLGGLALAVPLASSRLALFLPFPASLAWTAVTLAACSRFVRAPSWRGRAGWALVTALCWGQLAASHFAHGMVVGTGAVVAYLIGATVREVQSGRIDRRTALRSLGLLLASLPLVNLAYLLPRVAYLPGTSFRTGAVDLSGVMGMAVRWPLRFSTFPGYYLGAVTLALAVAGWWRRRSRPVVMALTLFGGLCYVISLSVVVRRLAPLARHVPGLDFYLHYPNRLILGVLIVLPILSAFGLQAWVEASSWRDRLLMLAPGVAVWFVLPPLVGAPVLQLAMLGGGAVVGSVALLATGRFPRLAWLVPAVLTMELIVNGLAGQSPQRFALSRFAPDPLRADTISWFLPLRTPDVSVAAYLRPGPIAEALAGSTGRYIGYQPAIANYRGYLNREGSRYWPLLVNQRGMLFDLQDAQGYNPVQLIRYWRFVRQIDPRVPLAYTTASVRRVTPSALNLLQVDDLITSSTPPPGATMVASEGSWKLYRLPDPPPRASVISSYDVAGSPQEALRAVTAPGFDPSGRVVLETNPGFASAPSSGGSATYRPADAQAAVVKVQVDTPSLVLVRTPFDSGWHASVDGLPVRILPADYLLQAIPVPAGAHTIELSYRDPWIGLGALGSGLAILALVVWAAVLRRQQGSDEQAG